MGMKRRLEWKKKDLETRFGGDATIIYTRPRRAVGLVKVSGLMSRYLRAEGTKQRVYKSKDSQYSDLWMCMKKYIR